MSDPIITTGSPEWNQNWTAEDIANMPVDVMAFYLALKSTEEQDAAIKLKMETIRQKQSQLSTARRHLTTIKNLYKDKTNATDEIDPIKDPILDYDDGSEEYNEALPKYEAVIEAFKWMEDNGMTLDCTKHPAGSGNPCTYYSGTKGAFEADAAKIENHIKDIDSSVELDMLSIQSDMSKRNQMLQAASTIMKKSNESKDSIIRNLG